MKNKRGEEMVEAAMVLPILILTVFTLMLVMVHYYDVHHQQIRLHNQLISKDREAVFQIKRQELHQQSQLDGMVNHVLHHDSSHRAYVLQPESWVLMGEMAEGLHE